MPRAVHPWTRTTTTTMTPISVPAAKQSPMDLYSADEKPPAYHDSHAHAHARDDDEAAQWSLPTRPVAGYKHCHNGRLKRILVPALIAILALFGVGALMCVLGGHMADPGEMVEGLFHVKRAVDGDGSGSGSGSGTESSFTKHKLYLIVIFVGLLVVVILGVMLSAWCCKGAFENPCCCPCYLCACCGGLACLECIGCGLCAEGVDQM
ncbi:hypothetical protein DFH08DRAFT_905312 [Mycena albidolilacea]|uniref:Transmembrane protein n=1 Tax=Mycena albidolilacea TaxID=1033008 RepID=A0AAD6Z0E7_9AGAR|nr:hypothetical protein DFH08DRAFT_905312 [Mycena albidolilacea]